MTNGQVVWLGIMNIVSVIASGFLIGSQYGWKTGLATSLITWALIPFAKADK